MQKVVLPQGARLARAWLLGLGLLPAALSCGCQSAAGNGALIGGAGGAALGTGIGILAHNPAAGALIGAGAGAAAGGITGAIIDEKREKDKEKAAAQAAAAEAAAHPPMGITDVVQLVQQHVDDSLIISQIRTTHSVFSLSANDLVYLKQMGVSDLVIAEMQATAYRTAPRRVYSAAPVYVAPPPGTVYVVEPPPPPPPPVAVGIGFGYTHYGHHW
jgi:hypothetical protein